MTKQCWEPSIRVLWFSLAFTGIAAGQSPEQLARTLRNKPSVPARASLSQYAKAHSKDQNGALALLALAVNDIEGKTPERAIPVLKQLDRRLPKLDDHVNLFLAQAYYYSHEYRDAARAASEIGQSPVLTQAASLVVNSYLEIGQAKDAVKYLRAKYTLLTQPQGEYLLATALEAAGDTAGAGTAYRNIYANFPKSGEGELSGAALERLNLSLTSRERYVRAQKLLDAGDGLNAKIEFQATLSELSSADQETARVGIGAAMLAARDYRHALAYLRGLKIVDPALDAERLSHAVTAARRAKEYAVMESLASELIPKDKSSRWRVEALAAAGNQAILDEDAARQKKFFTACADSTADSSLAPYCRWKIAFGEYCARKPGAFDEFLQLVERHPASTQASAALYFMGRLSESAKNYAAAKSFYLRIDASFANHYYAVLARERLSHSSLKNVVAQPAFPKFAFPDPTPDFASGAETRLRTERARMLATAGLDDYAEREIRYHSRLGGPAHMVAMELANLATRRGDPAKGIRFIKGNYPGYLILPMDRAPAEFWKLAYPMPFREDLEKHARSQNLDPFLVAGLIRQESEFNPEAVSRASARGLMQVMPSTGRELSRKLGIKPYSTKRLFEPKISLQMGTYHFRNWLNAEKGQIEVTLAAYNAGKSRADRWIAQRDYREPAEFVECIPFTETREYIQAVIRNADLYRRLYGKPIPGSDSRLASTSEPRSASVSDSEPRPSGSGN